MDNVVQQDTEPTKPVNDEADLVARLVEEYETSEQVSMEARQNSEKCRDYFDGKQYTSQEIAVFKARKQPPLVWNRIKRKVNFLTGHEIQQRMDPRAYPRNAPMDEAGAQAATDALRFVQDTESLPEKFSDAFETGIVEGYGGIEIGYNPTTNCADIKFVAWDRIYFDPYSSHYDFKDSTYNGIVVWMDEAQALRTYGDKKEFISKTFEDAGRVVSSTFDDKPRVNGWATTGKRRRIRICQHYYLQDGVWHWAHFTKGGLLKGGQPVLYVDNDGEPECPLILWSCYKDRENNRYGEVAELLDIQDEINKRRSKLLYSLSVRQVRADKGATDDREKLRNELARPDGVILTNPGKTFEILENNDQTAGQVQLLQEAKAEMEFAGPNSSLMGDTKAGASGRAIIASQQGGLSEFGRVMARYRNFKLRTYQQIWNRVRQFWKEEKWIRVTDDERNVRFVGMNVKMTVGETALEEAQARGAPPEELQRIELWIAKNPDEANQKTDKLRNNVAEMDVDIILDETVDTITIQQEQFTQLVELAKSGVVPLPPDVVIEASSLRNKDKLLEKLQAMQGPPEAPPEMQELQMRGATAEVAEKEAKAVKTVAETEKIQAETARNNVAFEASLSAPMNPGPVPVQGAANL